MNSSFKYTEKVALRLKTSDMIKTRNRTHLAPNKVKGPADEVNAADVTGGIKERTDRVNETGRL